MTEPLKIGGRIFRPVDLAAITVRQEQYIHGVFLQNGLHKITVAVDETAEEFVLRIWQKLLVQGRACEVLATFLVPDGVSPKDWRRDHASDVQKHIEDCTDPSDRQRINFIGQGLIAGFFDSGLPSLNSSLSYSAQVENEQSGPNAGS